MKKKKFFWQSNEIPVKDDLGNILFYAILRLENIDFKKIKYIKKANIEVDYELKKKKRLLNKIKET